MGFGDEVKSKWEQVVKVGLDAVDVADQLRKGNYEKAGKRAIDTGVDAVEVVPGVKTVENVGNKAIEVVADHAGLPKGAPPPPTVREAIVDGGKQFAQDVADWTFKKLHPHDRVAGDNRVPEAPPHIDNRAGDAVKRIEERVKEALEKRAAQTKDEPGTVTLPEVKIVADPQALAEARFAKQQQTVNSMDPRSVIVDGVLKPPSVAVNLNGKDAHVSHNDKAGLTTIEFKDQMGHSRAISFKEPMGIGPDGQPQHHPLQAMADQLQTDRQLDRMKIAIDGRGNTDYTVGNKDVQVSGHDGPGQPKDMPIALDASRAQAQTMRQDHFATAR